jgi:hypothetical protein
MPISSQTYGSLNPLLQPQPTTPTITGVNGPGAMQMSSGAQATMQGPVQAPMQGPVQAPVVPRGTNPAPAPVAAPQPTIGETLAGIKAQAMTVQQGIDALKASEKKGKLNAPTYDSYPTYAELYPEINQREIDKRQRKLFQGEIDATNRVYDDMLAQERLAGQGRLGTGRAISARGGLLGSDFGAAQESNITSANSQAQQAVQNERMAKIGGIMGTMRKAVADEMTEKRAARQQGAENYISYLASARERKENNRNLAARAILDSGLDPATMDPKELEAVGKEAGLSAQEIIMAYNDMKTTKDAEATKLDLETRKTEADISKINADIESGKLITIGEGTMLYNTETGEMMKNPKTYAPSTSGGGSGSSAGGYSSDLDAVIGATTLLIPSKFGQENFNKQIANARNPQDKLNLVASQVLRGQSADLRNDFSNLKVGASQLDKAIGLIDSGVQTGFLENGAQYAFNAFGKDYDPKLAELRSNVVAAIQPYRNSVTGAAWGTQEESEYQSLFGSNKYSPEELKNRLVTMKGILQDKQASSLNSMVNPLDYYDNQFNSQGQTGGSLRDRVDAAGYDYDAMKADGLSDDQISAAI